MNRLSRSLVALVPVALLAVACADRVEPAERLGEVRVVRIEVPEAPAVPPAAATPAAAAPATPRAAAASAASRRVDVAPRVARLVVAKNVEERAPVADGTTFTRGSFDRLYAYVELDNPGDETEVTVAFVPPGGGAERGNVSLSVGRSPRWRTWAYSRAIDRPGTWHAVVRTADGREIGRQAFEVVQPGA